jgi:BlaI family penicillinase repressor
MSSHHRLGDLQLAIMRILWSREEATASAVHAALMKQRGLAITTIKTMLRKMEDRGIVEHRTEGRSFVYRPAIPEADVREGMVGEVVERMFGGNGAALVNHLIQAGEIDEAELDQLRLALAKKRRQR